MTSPVSITFTYTRDEYILAMKRHYCATLKVGRDVIGGLLAMTTGIYLLFYSSDSWALTIILYFGCRGFKAMCVGCITLVRCRHPFQWIRHAGQPN